MPHSTLDAAPAAGVNWGMKLKFWPLAGLALLASAALAQTPEKTPAAPAAPAKSGPSAEARERKARSLEQLKAEEVPVIPDWPVLPDSTKAKVRPVPEVAQRAIAVCFTALKAEGASQD